MSFRRCLPILRAGLDEALVTRAELDQLANEIGEEILSRLRPKNSGPSPRAAMGIAQIVRTAKTGSSLAAVIDHTLLKPEATRADIARLCAEARQYGFASVCVNPCWVPLAFAELAGSEVKVCTVVGFPLGATSTAAKIAETAVALRSGAREIDMVMNVGALRSGDLVTVEQDIAQVVRVAHEAGAIVKVILETALLDDAQKVAACTLSKRAGADFVKTSTGFGPGGATVEDVALMRRAVGPEMGVKASGGIRTLADLQSMLAAGATRIGASAGVKIVEAAAA